MGYLNRRDKNTVLGLGALASYLEETIKEQEARNQTDKIKKLLKNLRTTRTYTYKSLDTLLGDIDEDEVQKTIKSLEYLELLIAYKNKAYKEKQRMEELDSTITLDREEFLDIVEQAIGVCQSCELGKRKAKECNLRKLFIKHDIEPLDPDAKKKCPYQY